MPEDVAGFAHLSAIAFKGTEEQSALKIVLLTPVVMTDITNEHYRDLESPNGHFAAAAQK